MRNPQGISVVVQYMNMGSKKIQDELHSMRKKIAQASFAAKEGHIPSAYSILEILYALKILDSGFSNEIELVLSKGHASLALYATLEHMGVITNDELMTFCETNSRLGGHPDSRKVPEAMVSSGSLGHGFPFSVGLAYATKISTTQKNIFCVLGDGEFNEGTTWEAALLSKKLNLTNLVCILDKNDSTENVISLMNIGSVFQSIGWRTQEVNGHDVDEIYRA